MGAAHQYMGAAQQYTQVLTERAPVKEGVCIRNVGREVYWASAHSSGHIEDTVADQVVERALRD